MSNGDVVLNVILLTISLLCSGLVFFVPFMKSKAKFHEFVKNNKDYVLAFLVLFIGSITRLCFLDVFPCGLNQDEASAGYDAYSIMKYGTDRNGMAYPVHLISWGSGQNALYSYLAIPFLALLGNTTIAIRLPMALVGTVSLYFLYFTFNKALSRKSAIISTSLFAILPWHVMKSRWALESNLFPDLILWGILLLMLWSYYGKNLFFYLSCIVFSLSSYSYGTSYFFLFFFIISMLVYLAMKRYQKWYHCIMYLILTGILCMPIILFLYINLFDKSTMHVLWFDIPKLKVDRFHSVTSLFSDSFFHDMFSHLKQGLWLIISQNDSLSWNAIPYFGTLYLFTLPFSFLGLFRFKDRRERILTGIDKKATADSTLYFLLIVSFIISLAMMLILDVNINRINIIWIPLFLSACHGIETIIERIPRFRFPLSVLYTASYLCFIFYYPIKWCRDDINPSFFQGFEECVDYIKDKEAADIYVTPKGNYTLVLYYSEFDTREYIRTVEFYNPGSAFENPKSFANYHFYLPTTIEEGNLYIVQKTDDFNKLDFSSYHTMYFKDFLVVDTTLTD